MMKQYLQCGKILTSHGIHGEVKVEVWADSPEYLYAFKTFYLDNGEKELKVESSRAHKNALLLKLKGIDRIEDTRELRGEILYIDRNDDPDDSPYLQDYIGMSVTDIDSKEDYGKIVRIIETGANNVFVLKDKKNFEKLIPVIPQVIIETDFENSLMLIRPLEGLFDD